MLRSLILLAAATVATKRILQTGFGTWAFLNVLNHRMGFGWGEGIASDWLELGVHQGTTNPVGQLVLVSAQLFPNMKMHVNKIYQVTEAEALHASALGDALTAQLQAVGELPEEHRKQGFEAAALSARALSSFLTLIPSTRVKEVS